jgi:hypothetical protein
VKPHKRSAGAGHGMDVWEESGKEIVHTTRAQQRHARKERAGAQDVVGEERACGWGRHRGKEVCEWGSGQEKVRTTHLPRDRNPLR